MKKFLMTMGLAVCWATILSVTVSCGDDEDDEPLYPADSKNTITINRTSLYEPMGVLDRMQSTLNDEKTQLAVTDTLLIYDETGKLVLKLGSESRSLDPVTYELDDLPDGTYTAVGWQATKLYNNKDCWLITGEDQLSTVSLISPYTSRPGYLAAGFAACTINISSKGGSRGTLLPYSIGSIVWINIDNLTEETGYEQVYLCAPSQTVYYGCHLDPNCKSEEKWIAYPKGALQATYGYGIGHTKTSTLFFTLAHGDSYTPEIGEDLRLVLYGQKKDGLYEIIKSEHIKLHTNQMAVYYLDMNRLSWQPPFFGNTTDYKTWKAEREKGILVFDPCTNWGCSYDDVCTYMMAKQWWNDGNSKLELWQGLGWHKWYHVAKDLTEQYIFETEDGKNLQMSLSMYHATDVPIEAVHESLRQRGYTYMGIMNYPGDAPCPIFLSPDGKSVACTYSVNGLWQVVFEPHYTDFDQYITPE